jgi:hypothetical protein
MWEHPNLPTLLQIGPEVQALPDAMRRGPSPSAGNPLYRSLETSETQTMTAWESGYVMQPNPDGTLKAIPKNGWGITLTLTPIQTMASESFRDETDPKPSSFKWFDVDTGAVAPFTFAPAAGKKIDVTITIPHYFAPFVESNEGVAIGDNGSGTFSFTLNGDANDSLTIGNTTSITLPDPNTGTTASILLPTLTFQHSGVPYSLNWSKWGADKKMVFGAYAHGWGYNIPPNTVSTLSGGKKAFGTASLYEENTTIHLTWGSENDTNGEQNCSAGYKWDTTTNKCVKEGSDTDEDEDGLDLEKYAQYGLIGLIAIGAISMLG